MLSASDSSAAVVNAVDVSGLDPDAEGHTDDEHSDEATAEASADATGDEHDHDHGAFNEHVFYSLHSMSALADEIAHQLGEIDPDQADTFTANADAFGDRVADLEAQAAEIKTAHDGESVAYTEPVPGYLFDEMGLVNVTPPPSPRPSRRATTCRPRC